MGEAVEQGRGHLGVAEDGGPFTEAQVGGDDDAGALVEFAQQVEEQGTARCAERQVSQLVQDHEIKPCQAFGDLAGFALGLFLFQGIDQFDGREEADFAVMMLDGLDAQGRGGMGLAGAWAADQHDILGTVEELALVQLAECSLVDLAGHEVEAGEVLVGREACSLHVIGDGAHLAFRHLGLQELRQDRHRGLEGGGTLFGQVSDGLGHTIHLQASEHDDDGCRGRIMTHGDPQRSGRVGRHSVRHWPSVRVAMSGPEACREWGR